MTRFNQITSLHVSIITSAVIGILKETLDAFDIGFCPCTSDLYDLIANFVGIIAAYAIIRLSKAFKREKNDESQSGATSHNKTNLAV